MKINKTLTGVLVATLVSAGATIAYDHQVTHADFDLPGLNQQVQNHEARISNLEKDTKALQVNTNTTPAANLQTVPVVTSTPITPTPAAGTPVIPAPTPQSTTPVQFSPPSGYILINGQWCPPQPHASPGPVCIK